LALATIPVDKARQEITATGDESKKLLHCLALFQNDFERARAISVIRLMLRAQFRAHESHSHVLLEQTWSSDFE
jgi:hypothetical protein